MQIIMEVVDTLVETIRTSNIFISIFLGLGIIILESIFPILPLALFIATNVLVFGNIFGFILSWVGTIMGEYLSSKAGLGYLINYGSQMLQLDIVMASIVILCLLAGGMYGLVVPFEKKCKRN